MKVSEQIIDGSWYVAADDSNTGKDKGWFNAMAADAGKAFFPGHIQDTLGDYKGGTAWFWNEFDYAGDTENCDLFLKMGFTEYVAEFWINGQYLGRFDGRMLFYEIPCLDSVRNGKNLLAIRISFAGDEELDGYVWRDLPVLYAPGQSPAGGILYPVILVSRPKRRLENVKIVPDYSTGIVDISYEIYDGNDGTGAGPGLTIYASVLSRDGELVAFGKNVNSLEIKNFIPWDFDTPYLYTLILNLMDGSEMLHSQSLRFGFRKFEVIDGWFHLNGRRVVMHATGNPDGFHPLGALTDTYELKNELMHIKSLGFNIIRYHNCAAYPEILDYCDEIGLGVWEGHAASWHMKPDGRFFDEIYERHMKATMLNGINHTSIIIWELINESHFAHEREYVVNILTELRKIDRTRMVFLGSGRWDRDMNIGSLSNPYSDTWNLEWGNEHEGAEKPDHAVTTAFSHPDLGTWTFKEDDTSCWDPELGDVHIYTRLPMTYRGKYILRHHCENYKPYILSECGGAGSGDPDSLVRLTEQKRRDLKNEVVEECKRQEIIFKNEFNRYGLGEVYPFIENLRRDAYKQAAEIRRAYIEQSRANPKFAGFQMCVSSAPHTGFGFSNCCRQLYPILPEMFSEVNAPLHWCLFVEPGHVYSGMPFTVEAVLSNEDVLGPGEYPVCARIVSEDNGCVWEYNTSFTIEEPAPGAYPAMAIPVFKETIAKDIPAGEYTVSVSLVKGGLPTGGHRKLTVSLPEPELDKAVYVIGAPEKMQTWLKARGVVCDENADTILVAAERLSDDEWMPVIDRVNAGATAVVICPEVLISKDVDPYDEWNQYEPDRLPVQEKGVLHFVDNWAFRAYTYLKKHSITEGLPIGVPEDRYYDQAEPIFILKGTQLPDELVGATLSVPYFDKSQDELHGYISGVTAGIYNVGKGKLIINTYELRDEVGTNPAAGRMLYNMLRY